MFWSSLDAYQEAEYLGQMVVLFLTFWGNSIPFFMAAAEIYIANAVYKGSVSPHPCQHLLFLVFLIITVLRIPGDTTLWFWFALPWYLVILFIFSCVCRPSVCYLWETSVQILLLFIQVVAFLIWFSYMSSLYIFDTI